MVVKKLKDILCAHLPQTGREADCMTGALDLLDA